MTNRIITLTISENTYKQAKRLADDSAQPVESILVGQIEHSLQNLSDLPPDEQAELNALYALSNELLSVIAQEKVAPPVQERVSLLLALNKRSALTDQESEELTQLLDYGDRITLRKAQAAAILSQRGYMLDRFNAKSDDV